MPHSVASVCVCLYVNERNHSVSLVSFFVLVVFVNLFASGHVRYINDVVTYEIKLFQNYFSFRRRPPEIILFQCVETRNTPEIISEALL